MAKDRHSLERVNANGYRVYAWLGEHEGDPVVKVHWRDPDGKPVSQPFHLHLNVAKEGFAALAAFAEEMRILHAAGKAAPNT